MLISCTKLLISYGLALHGAWVRVRVSVQVPVLQPRQVLELVRLLEPVQELEPVQVQLLLVPQ